MAGNYFLFQDKMQDSFFNTGDFFLESGVERVEPFEVPPRVYSLINTLGWAVVTLTPMLYYLLGLLLSGKLVYFSIGCVILGACKYLIFLKLNSIHLLDHRVITSLQRLVKSNTQS